METAATVAPVAPFAQEDVTLELPKKDRSGNYYVFFAGDLIDGAVKSHNPDWEAGGLLRPDSLGLKYKGGYVRKCEITNLRPQVVSEPASFIQPDERKHLAQTVEMHTAEGVVKLGEQKIDTNRRPTAKLGAVGVKHDGLLRTIFYPADEIGRLTGQTDGLVQMPCVNGQEAVKAQYFLFPNWDNILSGAEALPNKIADLEAYFTIRRNQAEGSWERNIATAALKSCTDFRDWGTKDTNRANSVYRSMQTKGYAWPYGEKTEMAFAQLGLQRQDTITQEQSSKIDRLTDSIADFVEAQIGNAGPKTPTGVTAEDLAEFFAWKADQEKAKKPAPVFDPLNENDPVVVNGKVGVVVNPKAGFGRVEIKFPDGSGGAFARKKVELIPEQK